MAEEKCKEGFKWCPIQKKCIPVDQMKGQGKGDARGQGHGPMGKPEMKEAIDLVDVILTGDYGQYKTLQDCLCLADEMIDEVENKIDNVPDQDIATLQGDVEDELSKDEDQKEEPMKEVMLRAVRNLLKEEDYRTFFKSKLDKWNIKSPTELSGDKKKEFFDQVDKEWKAKKESD